MQPWQIGDTMSLSSTKLITSKPSTPFELDLSLEGDTILTMSLSLSEQKEFSLSLAPLSPTDPVKLTRWLVQCVGIALTGFRKMALNNGSIPADSWNDLMAEAAKLKLTLTNDQGDTLSFRLVFAQTSCAGISNEK
jgi:hypothetical protein